MPVVPFTEGINNFPIGPIDLIWGSSENLGRGGKIIFCRGVDRM